MYFYYNFSKPAADPNGVPNRSNGFTQGGSLLISLCTISASVA